MSSNKPSTPASNGPWITLDYYDGPLAQISLVTLPNGEQLVEYATLAGWDVKEEGRTTPNGEELPMRHLRLSREDLENMLKLLNGNTVKDYYGKEKR